jgi:hypothetical protein
MIELLLTTFILPSLVTYILIKLLRGEHHMSKYHDDDNVFIMTIIYPLGFAYIFVRCLVKLHFIIRSRIEYLAGVIINELIDIAGSRYFCESFFGHPCPTSGKNYAAANAFGGRSRPASLVVYPTRGMQHSYAMTRRDFVKPAFSLRKKPLRENTCPTASGDYPTPISQRRIYKRGKTISIG